MMASGMGMPSMGIYSYELFRVYDVDQIIRIGSSGAYVTDSNLYDVVLAESVWSESSFARTQNGCTDDILYPGKALNGRILKTAEKLGCSITPVRVHSSDVFYCEDMMDDCRKINRKHHCTCVDMKNFALFYNACIIPVVTLTLYYGSEVWDGPKSLYEMMGIDEAWKEIDLVKNCLPDYRINLIDIREEICRSLQNPQKS